MIEPYEEILESRNRRRIQYTVWKSIQQSIRYEPTRDGPLSISRTDTQTKTTPVAFTHVGLH